MATTRIHDLAAEFGISSEQLMGMLKEMDIFVRSHLTPLKDEQVSLMRARWERDKRKQKQPATPPKRRRAAKAVELAAVPEPVAVADSRPKRRRRTAAPSSAGRESTTLSSSASQNGQRTRATVDPASPAI